MPKYRFVVSDGHRQDRTDEIELANDAVAISEAQRELADLAKGRLPSGNEAEFHVAVEDEAGAVFYQASLTFRGGTVREISTRRADGESKP